jgi:phenylpropionate dioxygenase-like ring-hydroxylating dioxygenase large terminal subunit
MATQLKQFELTARDRLTEDAGLSTGPVPLAPYHCPDFFEREKKQIFQRAWLLVCREEELTEPGSFIVKELPPTSVNALITRNKNGKIQAFHNTCSHRGSQIVYATEGKQSRFVCPYHRWTYTNEGDLVGVTDEANFFDLDKKQCGLTKIATEVWEGWVFLNLQSEPEVSLKEYLGDFGSYFEGYQYRGADHPIVIEAELKVNWKVLSDAFAETYHISCIHPGTLADAFTSQSNPFGRLLDAKIFAPHRSVSMFGNAEYEMKPENRLEQFAAQLGETGSVIAAATKEDSASYLSHPAVNPTDSPSWSMDVNHVFPHVQIDSGPGGFWTHWFWPLAANRSRYEGRFYMAKPETITERFLQELYISRVVTAICEDITSMERTQKGIESGGKRFMILQDSEIAIRHHVEQCVRWVEAESVKEALA